VDAVKGIYVPISWQVMTKIIRIRHCALRMMGSSPQSCINRLEEVREGELIVDSMKVHEKTTDMTSLRAGIGFVLQQFNLYPHMTALENITIALLSKPMCLGQFVKICRPDVEQERHTGRRNRLSWSNNGKAGARSKEHEARSRELE
jgi:ABC-type sugar transport system ATPase subunit